MNWISVNDKLPEDDYQVLIHMAKFGKANTPCADYLGYYENGKWVIEADRREIKDAENNPDFWFVTHWMTIDEPNKDA